MIKIELDERWVRLAMQTICTTSYSILVNGEPKGCLVRHIHLIVKES